MVWIFIPRPRDICCRFIKSFWSCWVKYFWSRAWMITKVVFSNRINDLFIFMSSWSWHYFLCCFRKYYVVIIDTLRVYSRSKWPLRALIISELFVTSRSWCFFSLYINITHWSNFLDYCKGTSLEYRGVNPFLWFLFTSTNVGIS